MDYHAISLREKLGLFTETWSPRVVAELNDYQVKLARIQGEFVWHRHEHTDELFLVLSGEMEILFRDGCVRLAEGDMYVVAKGIEHCPRASEEAQILIIEPRGVRNTGNTGGGRTADNDVWV